MNTILRAARISTPRLQLEPLTANHAAEMVPVLAGTNLYRYIGGEAPTRGELTGRYAAQSVGASPDGREAWLNWIIREEGAAVGFVQATVAVGGPCPTAYLAWVVGEPFQGRGIATEAARAVLDWLQRCSGGPVAAFIHPQNQASAAVACKLGLIASGELDEDGEERWDLPGHGTGKSAAAQ
ncbi:GNAT family N-acetyltransferase [Arthrobacter sp. zg-Y20]|uniref:GNAT family N-acetyltransferase n=1 Tax=unclassified Arthrobacter TaxID=235627 RepID=UPI001D1415F9|nr:MULTISPECIES: GNAT family N-acetyltransferase [unclassified Arthrobacter]MCC3274436.1 GNAT family N-acetyltransferase [Arthrobacter sp. zg-Y20]MDK1314592.1 GNAT family N-acetyltransferase [Arthrobacter sp. zg.Y20]WIB07575.1 GNAT family N-acetyltransferase [Arthrobacter sp. zg-Y20]